MPPWLGSTQSALAFLETLDSSDRTRPPVYPFYQQVQRSLLERMSTADHMAAFLTHQRRMMRGIQRLSRGVFYSDKAMINAVSDPEDKAERLPSWNMDQHKVNSNALILDVPWTTEECIGTSFANAGNRKVVLDLCHVTHYIYRSLDYLSITLLGTW
ncbi:hypothetical protein ACN42_g10958 [Penicillium freii]|uniref:DNA2/NAM7 helicase-like C-terminal domain-containing protein n=1 Tax=Penicillium freii TaxID=48697 RepID=A0A101M904_PENFR|nr:hypothetical protein ACN42_g10958 [Penicillium freii]